MGGHVTVFLIFCECWLFAGASAGMTLLQQPFTTIKYMYIAFNSITTTSSATSSTGLNNLLRSSVCWRDKVHS